MIKILEEFDFNAIPGLNCILEKNMRETLNVYLKAQDEYNPVDKGVFLSDLKKIAQRLSSGDFYKKYPDHGLYHSCVILNQISKYLSDEENNPVFIKFKTPPQFWAVLMRIKKLSER